MDPGLLEFFMPMTGMVVTFGFAAWVIWLLNRNRRERVLRQLAIQEKLIEKFASSQEFVTFLSTPEGQSYLRSFAEEPRRHPREKILKSIRTGVVLIILSAGLIAIAFMVGFSRPMEEPPFIIGFLALFLGLGFIGSALVSWTLSKMWGLLRDEETVTEVRTTTEA